MVYRSRVHGIYIVCKNVFETKKFFMSLAISTLLQQDLATLSSEAKKRKLNDIKEAAEQCVYELRQEEQKIPSAKSVLQKTFMLNQPKTNILGLNILLRMMSFKLIEVELVEESIIWMHNCLKADIGGFFSSQANLVQEMQLKLVQVASPCSDIYAYQLSASAVQQLCVLMHKLLQTQLNPLFKHSNDDCWNIPVSMKIDPMVSSSAWATYRQITANFVEKCPDTLAYTVFEDILYLAGNVEYTLKCISPISRTLALEMAREIFTNCTTKLHKQHFSKIIQTFAKSIIKLYSDAVKEMCPYPIAIRSILLVIQTILNFHDILRAECEILLSMLIKTISLDTSVVLASLSLEAIYKLCCHKEAINSIYNLRSDTFALNIVTEIFSISNKLATNYVKKNGHDQLVQIPLKQLYLDHLDKNDVPELPNQYMIATSIRILDKLIDCCTIDMLEPIRTQFFNFYKLMLDMEESHILTHLNIVYNYHKFIFVVSRLISPTKVVEELLETNPSNTGPLLSSYFAMLLIQHHPTSNDVLILKFASCFQNKLGPDADSILNQFDSINHLNTYYKAIETIKSKQNPILTFNFDIKPTSFLFTNLNNFNKSILNALFAMYLDHPLDFNTSFKSLFNDLHTDFKYDLLIAIACLEFVNNPRLPIKSITIDLFSSSLSTQSTHFNQYFHIYTCLLFNQPFQETLPLFIKGYSLIINNPSSQPLMISLFSLFIKAQHIECFIFVIDHITFFPPSQACFEIASTIDNEYLEYLSTTDLVLKWIKIISYFSQNQSSNIAYMALAFYWNIMDHINKNKLDCKYECLNALVGQCTTKQKALSVGSIQTLSKMITRQFDPQFNEDYFNQQLQLLVELTTHLFSKSFEEEPIIEPGTPTQKKLIEDGDWRKSCIDIRLFLVESLFKTLTELISNKSILGTLHANLSSWQGSLSNFYASILVLLLKTVDADVLIGIYKAWCLFIQDVYTTPIELQKTLLSLQLPLLHDIPIIAHQECLTWYLKTLLLTHIGLSKANSIDFQLILKSSFIISSIYSYAIEHELLLKREFGLTSPILYELVVSPHVALVKQCLPLQRLIALNVVHILSILDQQSTDSITITLLHKQTSLTLPEAICHKFLLLLHSMTTIKADQISPANGSLFCQLILSTLNPCLVHYPVLFPTYLQYIGDLLQTKYTTHLNTGKSTVNGDLMTIYKESLQRWKSTLLGLQEFIQLYYAKILNTTGDFSTEWKLILHQLGKYYHLDPTCPVQYTHEQELADESMDVQLLIKVMEMTDHLIQLERINKSILVHYLTQLSDILEKKDDGNDLDRFLKTFGQEMRNNELHLIKQHLTTTIIQQLFHHKKQHPDLQPLLVKITLQCLNDYYLECQENRTMPLKEYLLFI